MVVIICYVHGANGSAIRRMAAPLSMYKFHGVHNLIVSSALSKSVKVVQSPELLKGTPKRIR